MNDSLYGDGMHDDLPAIQEMLDSGASYIYLPPPEKHYLISGAIRIHSNQELKLDCYTRICLAPKANSAMLENAEVETWNQNITVSGGIWDMDHAHQAPNPGHFPSEATGGLTISQWQQKTGFDPSKRQRFGLYSGICFIFNSVKGLTFKNLTIVNPVLYGADFAYVEDFTIENIRFDYTEGSPKLWNMDGVHIEGFCKNGVIRNLVGACHDDTVAITSDDLLHGPIENIVVDGIYAEGSHSAVRLLSYKNKVKNIHITNIFGSYYVYGIIISKYYESSDRSDFENITIDHVYASLCKGTADVPGNYCPLIFLAEDMDIKSLYISHIFRNETRCPQPMIGIKKGTHIGLLSLSFAEQTNATGYPMTIIENHGTIDKLSLHLVDAGGDPVLVNKGTIVSLEQDKTI